MRTIDADALSKKLLEELHNRLMQGFGKGLMLANSCVINAPTIEPERKKGKWIEQDDCWDGVYYECSVYKEPFTLIDGTPYDNLYNFCPNCGAEMTSS